MIETPLEKAIRIADGQVALAKKVTESGRIELSQSTVSAWLNRFKHIVGADYVLAICDAINWQVTPNELRPDLYPHPQDGLPEHLRQVA